MVTKQQELKKRSKYPKATVTKITETENVPNAFDEARSDVKLAYGAFLEAREELAEAVKEQKEQGKQASRDAEKHYRVYQTIVEQAFKERETTEQQALETYKKSVEKAAKIYRENTLTALNKCKRTSDQAWKTSLAELKTNPNIELDRFPLPMGKNRLSKTAKNTKKYLTVWLQKASNFTNTKIRTLRSVDTQSDQLK